MHDKKIFKIFILYSLIVFISLFRIDGLLNEKEGNQLVNNNIEEDEQVSIYLYDNNGYLTKIMIDTKSNRKEEKILEIFNNMKTPKINNYSSVISESSELLNVYVVNNTVILNISEKLTNEQIEALVFAITDVEDVERIEFFVNDEEMNYRGSHSALDKTIGINHDFSSLKYDSSSVITTYFVKGDKFVPISYFVPNNEDVDSVFKYLKVGPITTSNIESLLKNNDVKFTYEIKEDEIEIELESNTYNSNLIHRQIAYSLEALPNINKVVITYKDNIVYSSK